MYKINKTIDGVDYGVIRLSDQVFLTPLEDSQDYQAYLAWVAEGNIPEPADEVTQ